MNTAQAVNTILALLEGFDGYANSTVLEAKDKLLKIYKHAELVDGLLKAQAAKYTPKRKEEA